MMSRIVALLALVAAPFVSSCDNKFSKDAVFNFSGTVSDSAGSPAVLGANEGIKICALVSYNEKAGKKFVATHSATVCEILVTDQVGRYSIQVTDKLFLSEKESDTVEIKNLKLFASKYIQLSNGNVEKYIMPAKIEKIETNANGASIESNVVVLDF